MQLKDVTCIIRSINELRASIPEFPHGATAANQHNRSMRGGIRKVLRIIEKAPVVEAVPFDTIAHMCKCSHLACVNPDLQIFDYVCGHTIPKGQSWGVCSFNTCPLIKEKSK